MLEHAIPPLSQPAPSDAAEAFAALGPLSLALSKKGYTTLTPVQAAVLDPRLAGRDLRISSQTGSGKTLAIGFVLRELVEAQGPSGKNAQPHALLIVPTRELAQQVERELSWLFAPLKLRVTSVTGGASYRDEHRALAQGPAIVVGTPGRLLDHLKRRSVDASAVRAVVLDEADQMLDLGFREELEAILALLPTERRTHLVSATFPREVTALADRVQKNARRVEGTPPGDANLDIDHVVYLVEPRERVDALINVLLHHPDDQTLVFARTRADVAEIARELQVAGFLAGSLSGEMEQAARNRALAAFKRRELLALVATDVAARGIDVQDIARVVQVDPPSSANLYTHRSGRTGRAGRKGTSALLIPRSALRRTEQLLGRVGVEHRVEAVPSADAIRKAQDERWLARLVEGELAVSARVERQAERIVASGLTNLALLRLLNQVQRSQGEPREITKVSTAPDRHPRAFARAAREQALGARDGVRAQSRDCGPRGGSRGVGKEWVSFRVTWGDAHGADARRLVAMLCRRGKIKGSDIGAIHVARTFSNVDVSADVAAAFAEATGKVDPRDPRVKVTLLAPHQFRPTSKKPRARKSPRRV